MPRTPRISVPGCTHHVMARGLDGIEIFGNDEDRLFFLNCRGIISRGRRDKRSDARKPVIEKRERIAKISKKECPKCKLKKPLIDFGQRGGKETRWVNSWCKSCHGEYSRKYRERDGEKERQRLYKREYRLRKR